MKINTTQDSRYVIIPDTLAIGMGYIWTTTEEKMWSSKNRFEWCRIGEINRPNET